jgi:uncharacterized protein (DUF2147 family)
MKKYILIVFSLLFIVIAKAQPNHASAVTGEWLTAAKDVKILIFEESGKFHGKMVWGNHYLGKDAKNPDRSKRGNEILGSVMLKGFVFNGKSYWEDGEIYDPTSGKTYSCIMKLQDANTLEIRGYIGIPLLGRTEILTRSL